MTITKEAVQRVVSISIGADGAVTHAWQQATFSIREDGAEISRQLGPQENIEPADIGAVVPQAGLLKQLADLQAKHDGDAATVAATLEATQAAAASAADGASKVQALLQAELDAANGKLEVLAGHVGEAAKLLS